MFQLTAVRALRAAHAAVAGEPAHLRKAQRQFRPSDHRPPGLRRPVRAGPDRADLPGDACGKAQVPGRSVRKRRRDARHVRVAQRRQGIPPPGGRLRAHLRGDDLLRHGSTEWKGSGDSALTVQLLPGSAALVPARRGDAPDSARSRGPSSVRSTVVSVCSSFPSWAEPWGRSARRT